MWGPGCTPRSHVGGQGGLSPLLGPQQALASILGGLVMVKDKDSLPGKCQHPNASERASTCTETEVVL